MRGFGRCILRGVKLVKIHESLTYTVGIEPFFDEQFILRTGLRDLYPWAWEVPALFWGDLVPHTVDLLGSGLAMSVT